MANITGTNGKDILLDTSGDDTIWGLAGDDRIISNGGIDTIDGGTGNDVVDYSKRPDNILVKLDSTGSLKVANGITIGEEFPVNGETIVNIETIISQRGNRFNSLNFENAQKIDLDLSKNRVTYSLPSIGTKTLTVKNFTTIIGSPGSDRLKGDDSDNRILGGTGGDDVILGSKGNDLIFGGGFAPPGLETTNNTLDYSDIGRAVKITLPASCRYPLRWRWPR